MTKYAYLFEGLTLRRIVVTALIALAVAIPLLWIFMADFLRVLASTMIVSFTIMLAFTIGGNIRVARVPRAAMQMITVLLAAPLGTLLTAVVRGGSIEGLFTQPNRFAGTVIIGSLGLGLGWVIGLTYIYREQKAVAEAKFLRAEAERHQLGKKVLEAQLQLLQAQIEPHFLFNTLANVQHLVESDSKSASRLLENLIRYLRIAMPQMRDSASTLGREMDMAAAYLEIFKMRMGSRLTYQITLPDALRNQPFPPMMLITLVENAIKHGVDPCCDSAVVVLSAEIREDKLLVSVADTGEGLKPNSAVGVGLTNIRERLGGLFGKSAKLHLCENQPRGVIATMELPWRNAA